MPTSSTKIANNACPYQPIGIDGDSVLVSEHSHTEPRHDGPHVHAPLENLPAEIRRELLSTLGFDELSALVHASPIFHQQYLLDRRILLCKCLEETLRGATVDACAVYRTNSADLAEPGTGEDVIQFLHRHRERCSWTQDSVLTESLVEDEALSIATFYNSIVKPLARRYTDWALANLADETRGPPMNEAPSKTEEVRLLRALYRFQLCCKVLADGRRVLLQRHPLTFPYKWWDSPTANILSSFVDLFEPWEIEEIACILTFAREKYYQVFGYIDNDSVGTMLAKGSIAHGLELLHIVFSIKEGAHPFPTIQEYISWPEDELLETEALSESAQFERRQQRPSIRHEKQRRRDPLPFNGDGESDSDGPRPPLAWTLMWGGTYSNLYGCYVPDEIRSWGYVFWDASRIERTGAKAMLARQLESDWVDGDPRDMF